MNFSLLRLVWGAEIMVAYWVFCASTLAICFRSVSILSWRSTSISRISTTSRSFSAIMAST